MPLLIFVQGRWEQAQQAGGEMHVLIPSTPGSLLRFALVLPLGKTGNDHA